MSDTGIVKCLPGVYIRKDGKPYTFKEQIKKPYKTWNGYYVVHMARDVDKYVLVHRAVMETFNPVEEMENLQVNHIDGDKSNNCLNNLEWMDRSENMRHAFESGIWHPSGTRKEDLVERSDEEVADIIKLVNEGELSQKKIASLYGISTTRVRNIQNNRIQKYQKG